MILESIRIRFKEFYNDVLRKKQYYLPVLVFTFMAYGFNLISRSVSMDDMAFQIFGEGLWGISLMRWGIYLIAPFINTKEYSPFVNRFFALVFFLISSGLFSFLIYSLNKKRNSIIQYVILSSLFLTYPLINEIWEFSAMSVNISYNGVSYYYIFVFLALIYQYYANEYSIKSILISGLLLTPVMAGYESVVFAYITLVLIIIYYKSLNNEYKKKTDWFFDGIRYALPLVVALILRLVIGHALILIFNAPNRSSLSRSFWAENGFKATIIQILYNGWYYIIRAFSYMPVNVFLISVICFIVVVIDDSKKKIINLLLGLFILLSLFLLSFVQGDYLYYRTAQTVQVFVAFVGSLLYERSLDKKIFKYDLNKIVIAVLLFVCLRQSIYLHELLALNTQRSDNEAYIAREIGYRIYSEFDKDKIVVFCGEYQLGDFIESQIVLKPGSIGEILENKVRDIIGQESGRYYQEFVANNINSYFNKQMDAANGQIMIKRYLSYYGFDINVLENLSEKEEDKLKGYYENIAKRQGMKPLEIRDMGEYILVYLGPTIDGYHRLKY